MLQRVYSQFLGKLFGRRSCQDQAPTTEARDAGEKAADKKKTAWSPAETEIEKAGCLPPQTCCYSYQRRTGEARCGAHVFEGVFGLEHEPVKSVKMKAKQGPRCSGGSPIRTKPLNPTHNVKRGDSSCFCHYDRQNSFILKEATHKARKNPKYDLHLSSSSVTTRSSKYSLNSQRKTTRCSSVVFLVGVRLQSVANQPKHLTWCISNRTNQMSLMLSRETTWQVPFFDCKNAKKCNSLKQPPKIPRTCSFQAEPQVGVNFQVGDGFGVVLGFRAKLLNCRQRARAERWFSETTRCLEVWLRILGSGIAFWAVFMSFYFQYLLKFVCGIIFNVQTKQKRKKRFQTQTKSLSSCFTSKLVSIFWNNPKFAHTKIVQSCTVLFWLSLKFLLKVFSRVCWFFHIAFFKKVVCFLVSLASCN